MPLPTSPLVAKLISLQRCPSRIRNLCILAHVDHGKTTLADALVASNGLISQKMAGKLRYMDSRPDEQERGITMKSSAVTLTFRLEPEEEEYLLNLIDSPGHVDFSSEVSTAVRLCDGAIVVVDVVEGVQPQTKVVLSQAYLEGIRPVLVLNKIDRLVTEVKMTPLDAYLHLRSVLEQVNAVIGELFAADVMGGKGRRDSEREKPSTTTTAAGSGGDVGGEGMITFDWSTGLEEADDSELYFSPEHGNVVFASAYDGWAFDVATFAGIFARRMGFNEQALAKTLWGDFYVNVKAKKILSGAQAKAKKPLFVQLVLENIWSVYEAAVERKDKERLLKIAEALQIKIGARDLRSTDPKQHVNAIFTQWLPLAPCLLSMVCRKLPSPNSLEEDRVRRLMCSRMRRFETLPKETQQLKEAFLNCSAEESAPVIVFVSKMFPVQRSQLPKNRSRPLSVEEMAARRDKARQLHEEKMQRQQQGAVEKEEEPSNTVVVSEKEESSSDTAFIAFARVFSGTLRAGKAMYVLGPKYDPSGTLKRLEKGEEVCDENATVRDDRSGLHIMRTTVSEFYLLLGRDLEALEEVPAGNIIGLGGLEDYILKSATLTSDVACPAFIELSHSAVPILRVAVEPLLSSDMSKLVQGLHLLNQADANVNVSLTDKGEHILVTAGEVHLERCLRDLKETYAGVEVVASAPIVPFRETIVRPPKTDMVNEEFSDENKVAKSLDEVKRLQSVEVQTPNKKCVLKIRAVPLPQGITRLLESSSELLKTLEKESCDVMSIDTLNARDELKTRLWQHFLEEGRDDAEFLRGFVDNIWSFGPRKCGPNILVNNIPGYARPSLWEKKPLFSSSHRLSSFDSSIVNGFQLATVFGPLCEEPLMGVAFVIEDCILEESLGESDASISGQIISTVKDGCRRAFQAHPQRLMAAMYTCDIQVKAEVLGKLFASLGKRHGKIVKEEMVEGSSTFTVTAHLPVVESLQFAQEIRRQTSGLAMPQLVFSHWEVVDVDPYWVPQSAEEILHFGDKADSENQARRYMNDLRKRKGLAIDEKIVEFAEKQRTLSQKK